MYKNRIDKPITNKDDDSLKINIYKQGLINYLENCNTPMTISIQGEWGSGKTSLLNLIKNELQNNNDVFTINTWNYSLFEESEVPMKVFLDLLNALESRISDKGLIDSFKKHKETFWKIGKAVTRVAAARIAGGAETALDEFGESLGSKDLERIKEDIEKAIIQITNNNSKVIFLIDDLDRLNPELAIKVLEILKNIFDCEGSIFILAIDYEVVVKGLKNKFGDYEKNEREYRQFFDKIVQLPFSMPIEDYSLDEYLKDQLTSVSYFDENKYLEDEKNINYLTKVCSLTIGNNPRAIKRVVNYLSLIDSIIEAKEDNTKYEDIKKALQFALISIQVAYPLVYKLLAKEPNYLEWNDDLLESVEEVDFEKVNFSEEQRSLIDEEWEQTLYKYIIGVENNYLSSKVLHILECLNIIRKHISIERVKNLIYEMIQISSVTSATVNNIKVEQTDYSEIWSKINKKIDSKIDVDRKSATSNKMELIQNITYSISIRKDSVAIFVDFKKSARTNKDKFDSLKIEINDDKRIV
ncbi:MAG: P-loop NTPase fold protein, partial [Campylobacterota bacterium]|nr:P-loop NTPase fold protein [Campylobacterota bacterium]